MKSVFESSSIANLHILFHKKLLPILKSVPFTYALSLSYKSKYRYDNPIPYQLVPSTNM